MYGNPVSPVGKENFMSRNWLLSVVAVIPLLAVGGIASEVLNSPLTLQSVSPVTIDVHQIQTGIDARTLPELQISNQI